MQKFKIFYSWQSDLPGNKTRNFIRECIDEAINLAQESETFEAERDEATTGTTGSPNIVTAIFSKIDNCDLFIADVSLCFTEDRKKEKRSPNPNVLLELGYAVKTLGWERVICLCNSDFGNKYPFNLAHNRITDFSLEGKSKKEVKGYVAKIIFSNIRDLRKQGPRAKEGMAYHIIGTYDFDSRKVINTITQIEISYQESFVRRNKELLHEANILLAEIQELNNRIKENNIKDAGHQDQQKHTSPIKFKSPLADVAYGVPESFRASETAVIWEDVKAYKERIKRWLAIEVPEEFFDMGRLKQVAQLPGNSQYNESDNEVKKYNKLRALSFKLLLLDIRKVYLKTFEGMSFIPLAIQNVSLMQDTDIRVVVSVEIGEIVEPHENLISESCMGLQGALCRDNDKKDEGIIHELFSLKEDEVIHIEHLPYNPSKHRLRMPILTGSGLSQPHKTEEDYKDELEEFIASTGGRGFYEFEVSNLRPGECRWLSCGLLVKPADGIIKVQYRIHSSKSAGDLNGTLQIAVN